jgi:hypothetical protein
MSAHLTKPVPPISTVNENLPAKTDAVFGRVLAKNPDDRYQSCAEFVTALQEAVGGGEVRYPASAPTLAAATPPKRGTVDPDAPTQLRKSEPMPATPQRKSRAVPILASAVGVLAATAAVLGVYATRGGSGDTATTASSTPSSVSTTSSLPPAPPPPVVTTTAAISTPVPTQTRTVVTTTVAAAPAPYVGMPCTDAGKIAPGEQGEIILCILDASSGPDAGRGAWKSFEINMFGSGVLQLVEKGARCTKPKGVGTAWARSTDNYLVRCTPSWDPVRTEYNPNTVWEPLR